MLDEKRSDKNRSDEERPSERLPAAKALPPKRAQIVLSGTKPTGENLHLGNYFGALRPVRRSAGPARHRALLHRRLPLMTTLRSGPERRRNTLNVALDYPAAGLDPARAILFRQSDLPEVRS
ncbi:MAG: hypothetical protein R3F21_08330 [Myxococcota bacterium]